MDRLFDITPLYLLPYAPGVIEWSFLLAVFLIMVAILIWRRSRKREGEYTFFIAAVKDIDDVFSPRYSVDVQIERASRFIRRILSHLMNTDTHGLTSRELMGHPSPPEFTPFILLLQHLEEFAYGAQHGEVARENLVRFSADLREAVGEYASRLRKKHG